MNLVEIGWNPIGNGSTVDYNSLLDERCPSSRSMHEEHGGHKTASIRSRPSLQRMSGADMETLLREQALQERHAARQRQALHAQHATRHCTPR